MPSIIFMLITWRNDGLIKYITEFNFPFVFAFLNIYPLDNLKLHLSLIFSFDSADQNEG